MSFFYSGGLRVTSRTVLKGTLSSETTVSLLELQALPRVRPGLAPTIWASQAWICPPCLTLGSSLWLWTIPRNVTFFSTIVARTPFALALALAFAFGLADEVLVRFNVGEGLRYLQI